VLFAIRPAIEKGSWTYALLFGAFFGLIAHEPYLIWKVSGIPMLEKKDGRKSGF
jgi:uncharacterized membrane protein